MNTGKWIVIVVVAVLVAGAAAGFGGYTMGKTAGTTQALAARDNFFAARGQGGALGGGGAQGGPGGFAGAGRGGTFGQVKQINGDTIDLSTATAVVKVKVTGQTQIQKQAEGVIGDLKPGERITVIGETGSDGVVTAQRIQLLPANVGGPNGQQQAGGGGRQPTTTPGTK